LDKYLKEIGNINLLSPEDEQKIAEKAHEGDKKAREILITHNLRYVVEVAKSYQGQGLSLEELIAEGNVGIVKAAGKFDPSRKMKFITYAVWWIRQSILQALSEKTRLVRIPINKINEIQKERKKQEELLQTTGGLLGHSNFSEINEMYSSFPLRLDGYINEDQPIIELFVDKNSIPPDELLDIESFKIDLETVLDNMSDREVDILKYYHGIGEHRPFTLEEIGNILGLTRERIRQIKKKSLEHINNKTDKLKLLTKYI